MLKNIDHLQGVKKGEEILFDTPFGYIFDYLCYNSDCRLPNDNKTIDDLCELGTLMADLGTGASAASKESNTPAIYTYIGQFIDHDITARTDREEDFKISNDDGNKVYFDPAQPSTIIDKLKNGRRPNLDLDSVFGDGPSFFGSYKTQADDLYDSNLKLKINQRADYIDLPRDTHSDGEAIIADHRNDENVMISQLHAAIIAFYNRTFDGLPKDMGNQEKYSRARQLTTWAYQCMVVNDYLPQVCDPDIVRETLLNGPYYFGPFSNSFMPLEFSVAAFRFGHSMIRPSYGINGNMRTIDKLIGVTRPGNALLDSNKLQLKEENVIRWSEFTLFSDHHSNPQMARKIDSKIAEGLFKLDHMSMSPPLNLILAKLAQRNLLRGYLLSLPTGQSIAQAMRIFPLTPQELQQGNSTAENTFLNTTVFLDKTPLWYYILKESEVHHKGERLGAVGSKLVAETLIGLLKKDPNSYLNNAHDKAITEDGIKFRFRATPICRMTDILEYGKVPIRTTADTTNHANYS